MQLPYKRRIPTRGWIQRGWGAVVRIPSGNSQVAIGFLRNSGTDPSPLEKQLVRTTKTYQKDPNEGFFIRTGNMYLRPCIMCNNDLC